MKLTLSWLKKYLNTTASPGELAERMTALGLEVESVTDRSAELAPFTVAYVEAAEQHPNADRLRVCKVNTGSEVLDVVCGAPNARAGMKGVFAPLGSHIPGTGITLEKREIRGVTGFGMLCSEREMGLSDDHEGIIELPGDAPVGAPYAQIAGLDDPVFDIAITPDRADCLGVLGIARDLAATGIGTLVQDDPGPVTGKFPSPVAVRLAFSDEAQSACPLFVGRYFRGVSNGPSPKWLQTQLLAIGLRPISALVDITNYVTFDLCRPLHVFDADKLAGGIHVRLANRGESLAALDDRDYALDQEMTVVADDSGPVALGGVIGGRPTGCEEDTKNVFLEAALFDPVRTATTGRKLQIDSDARYRFERGVDQAGTISGIEAATRLILEICGGEASELVIAGEEPDWHRSLNFSTARVGLLGGLNVASEECARIMDSLGFEPTDNGATLSVSVPSWRRDIDGEADLVEEVLRVKGFDEIPAVSMVHDGAVAAPAISVGQRKVRLARRILASRGLHDCVTWSFLSADHGALFGGPESGLDLENPITSELTTMRPTILPNLLTAVSRNQARDFADFGLFEVGPVYANRSPEGQSTMVAGVRTGHDGPRHWRMAQTPVGALDAKADALALLDTLGAPVERVTVTTDAPTYYHPGRSGQVRLGPKMILATFGEVHPELCKTMDVAPPIVAFEVHLDAIPQAKTRPTRARPAYHPSDLPAVDRDFAFVVDDAVTVEQLFVAVRSMSGKLPDKVTIHDLSLFDVYAGEGVPAGKKSLAIGLTLQPIKETLTGERIQEISDIIVSQVTKRTGGILRA